jgi:hypothetical protein
MAAATQQKRPLDYRHVTSDGNHNAYRYTVEASCLGLKAGEAPPRLIQTTMGNGMPFYCVEVATAEGELVGWNYQQDCGCLTLTIWND